jgi:hypothetical protein
VLEIAKAESQRKLYIFFGDSHYATALSNYTWLAFILNSDLKSVKVGPQRLQLTVKRAKRGQSGGTKSLLRFLKNSHPLRPRFDVFKVPKRGRSGGTKKSKKNRDFCQSGNENGG